MQRAQESIISKRPSLCGAISQRYQLLRFCTHSTVKVLEVEWLWPILELAHGRSRRYGSHGL